MAATTHLPKQNWPYDLKAELLKRHEELRSLQSSGAAPRHVKAPSELKVATTKRDLAGCIVLEGRSTERKHNRINGTYAQLQDRLDGNLAFEKVVDEKGAELYIYYAVSKGRWKISTTLGDEKGGLAQLKTSTASSPADVGDSVWVVYEGKEDGYRGDPLVKCTRPNGASTANHDAGKSVPSAVPASLDAAPVTPQSSPPPTADAETVEIAPAPAPSSPQPTAESGAPPPAGSTSSAHRGSSSDEIPESPVKSVAVAKQQQARVCAKMLARSSLRCHCHFVYMKECPERN